MSTDLDRRPLTAAVKTQLETLGKPVGDGVIPDGMWIGQPNLPDSEFEPFSVVSELRAGASNGSLAVPQADWRLPYLIEAFGTTREQCGWIAGKIRDLVNGLKGTTISLGPGSYKVQYVGVDVIGEPQRIDVVDPPFYHSQDSITVWLGKRRT